MTAFALRDEVVTDDAQQRNNLGLLTDLNSIAQFVSWGSGAPTHTPTAPQLYFNRTGAAGSSAYFFNNTAWTAVA